MPPRLYAKRTRNLYDPSAPEGFRVSRSKIDLFHECPRCFYLDVRLGIPRPSFPAFTLNNAVDELLKREFDAHRAKGEPHPLMQKYKIDAVPLSDERLDAWRDALRHGVQYHHPSGLIFRGGVDDIWVNPQGELIVVDYKATSKKEEVTIDGYWQQGYKRQVEIYQWLLRGIGEKVSDIAYFVYVNGNSDAKAFDAKLEFDVTILAHKGSVEWIEPLVAKLGRCLQSEETPAAADACEYCRYREIAGKELQGRVKSKSPKQVGLGI
ncbi:PD-(D/E)XK nuclease family protein [Candidatus Kaiserbacteria bacterium]|nr:PD-(D/E)XK nuclease family protein [Candidatus Kaiserbacteria bacterium]